MHAFSVRDYRKTNPPPPKPPLRLALLQERLWERLWEGEGETGYRSRGWPGPSAQPVAIAPQVSPKQPTRETHITGYGYLIALRGHRLNPGLLKSAPKKTTLLPGTVYPCQVRKRKRHESIKHGPLRPAAQLGKYSHQGH